MQITPMVKQLLIITIICYVGSIIAGPTAYNLLALHFPGSDNFGFWQFLTYMFMHSDQSLMHILFNMLALYMFGSTLERMWGANKLLFFYISCGVGAGLLHTAVNYIQYISVYNDLIDLGVSAAQIKEMLTTGMANEKIIEAVSTTKLQQMFMAYHTPMVGASGATYGLMVAFAFLFPNVPMMMMFIPIPIKAKYLIGFTLLTDLVLGFMGQSFFGSGGTGIAHFAHLGGALIGFIMMWYWKQNQFKSNRWN